MQERVYYGRKVDTVDQLKQAIMLECRTATSFTTSDNGNVVCIDQNGGHIEHTLHCLYCKIIVVTDVMLKHFLSRAFSTTFFAN